MSKCPIPAVPQRTREPLPVFASTLRGGLLVITCPYCKAEHAHEFPGGRVVAGCADAASPYAERGYIVRLPGR
jgi:hypothetical protein